MATFQSVNLEVVWIEPGAWLWAHRDEQEVHGQMEGSNNLNRLYFVPQWG